MIPPPSLDTFRLQALGQALFDSLEVGVFVLDSSGLIVQMNPAGTRLVGWSETLILGKHPHEVFDCRNEGSESREETCPLAGTGHLAMPMRIPRVRVRSRAGEWKWVELSARALDEYGAVGTLVIFRDLSDDLRLAEDYGRLASIPEECPFPIVEVEGTGNLLYANPAMVRLMEQAGVRSDGFSAALPENFPRLLKACLSHNILEQDVEVDVGQKHFAWLFSPHPELGLVRGFGLDVTDRRQAADELAAFADLLETKNRDLDQALVRAEAATQAKAAFLATMSHEIRTPLNGVIGMTDILIGSGLTPSQRDSANMVKASAEALLIIINDILDFSKIEAGKFKLETIPFNLRNVIEEVVDLFAERAQKKGLDLAGWILPEVPCRLQGDPTRLRQILSNFLGNAIKFTEHGHVLIRVETPDSATGACSLPGKEDPASRVMVRFSVEDTGVGISEEAQSRLFQAFSQADVSTTRKYGGTGLGLAICRQMADLMGGSVGVKSTPGGGATFWCHIPFLSQQPEAQEDSRRIPGIRRVLLVGCPPATGRMLLSALQAAEVRCVECSTPERGVGEVRKASRDGRPFDAVICYPGKDDANQRTFISTMAELAHEGGVPMILLVPFWRHHGRNGSHYPDHCRILTTPIHHSLLLECLAPFQKKPSVHPCPQSPQSMDARVEESSWTAPAPDATEDRLALVGSVLVAEDNPVNQRVASWMLEKHGCRVTIVNTGREAVEAVVRDAFDLILMDWQMPEKDGLQATLEIRQMERAGRRNLAVPIVGMTANVMEGDRERCLEAGMDDWLPKPIRAEELKKILLRWLPSSDKEAENKVDPREAAKFSQGSLQGESGAYHDKPVTYDVDEALRVLGGDRELLGSLIGLFLASAPPLMDSIRQAFRDRQWDPLRKGAHQLKGALGTLHANAAAEAAAVVEARTLSEDVEKIEEALQKLDHQYAALLPVLEEFGRVSEGEGREEKSGKQEA